MAGAPKLRCAGVAAAGALLLASGGTGTAHAAPTDVPGTAQAADASTAKGTTYYVDASRGSDYAPGTSANTAWKSLARVERAAFKPGDTVAFKRGGKWSGQLTLRGDGTAQQRITLTSYGLGSRPRISGGADCLDVRGSHWVIANVQVSGCGWAGVELRGSYNVVAGVRAEKSVAGIVVDDQSHHNTIRDSQIVGNDRMVAGRNGPDDDAGAFGILLNGDDNLVRRNLITGSSAPSPDYGQDGAAVEIYNGDRNRVDFNVTRQNDAFTELGHAPGKTAARQCVRLQRRDLVARTRIVPGHPWRAGQRPRPGGEHPRREQFRVSDRREDRGLDLLCGLCAGHPQAAQQRGQGGRPHRLGRREGRGRGHRRLRGRRRNLHPRTAIGLRRTTVREHHRPAPADRFPAAGRAGEPTKYHTDVEGKPVPTDGPRVGAYQDTR
ncbi:right-handed parallel beta-helix repeat-containing protein [Yinghuangia aomiensis]